MSKSKVIPVLNSAPHHEDVLGEWRYISTYSLISALGGGEWSVPRSGKEPLVPIRQAAGWDPEPVWTGCRREKFPAPAGNRKPIIRSTTP
jgi:hypothetical protein